MLKLKRPAVFLPSFGGLLLVGTLSVYLILVNPGSIFVRWARR